MMTEWCQPLRSSKNAKPPKRQLSIDRFCVAGSSSLEALSDYSGIVGRPHKGGRLKWSLNRTITSSVYRSGSKKSRKTHLDTHKTVEGGAENGRKTEHGMDVPNTRRSAGTILTGCNYAGHGPK